MPDLWMDVDTALTEVPVNILSLIDDTDFKTRETAVAYNAAGMNLAWNFVTTAGVFSQTPVTPTNAGDYDWVSQGDGMYAIEMPASGGGSINNDTEGVGWFTGIATGILPWRGPTIGFRAAGLNNALIDSAYSATRGLAGTALPDAAAEASGGLYTRGSGAGQINQPANGQVDVNVEKWNATNVPAEHTAGYPVVTVKDGTGTGEIDTTSGGVLVAAIAANAITATSINADAITAAKVADGTIDAATFATGAITATAIAADAIGSSEIADGAITSAKFASGAITATVIATDAIDADAIAADAIGSSELAAGAVTEIQSGLATSAALATVDTVVDAILALLDDARAEPGQGAPPVNPNLATKVDYLYKFLRNEKAQTSTTLSIFADDGSTVDHKATVSDDTTTYTHGEVVSGP